ncbi:hypothetical protein HYALB_00008330 [Hymenoscyphus albidus]|uniref:Thioredoxin-like fold domain-containing protein n=1 Tax=Hymenoscyphus albidus TaxID=595503 RepID=A0A9N9LGZ9_9HELO|nr:hypothetical protein HYALB_00008330 [Hymenoscyphus albidus]
MALAPKFAAQKFSALSQPQTLHTLELFLDYVCPFSAKMFNTVYSEVFPLIREKYADKVQVVFRQQVQPWHPSSTLVHEAAVGVVQLGGNFWGFSDILFKDAKSYYDVNVVNETRNQTYGRLAKLGAKAGVDEDSLLKLLLISDKPGEDGSLNTGNGVTNNLKVLIKMNRLVGVHVSPTVIFDGVVENSISSSFTGKQWAEWLESNVA